MRSERYRDLAPPERLAATRCSVIGVGAIGRQVALQLAAIGVQAVQIIDHDVVEEVNLGPQGYCAGDVGQLKVQATARLMADLNPDLAIGTVPERFAKTLRVHPVVFCCVDSIATRRHIWPGPKRGYSNSSINVVTVASPFLLNSAFLIAVPRDRFLIRCAAQSAPSSVHGMPHTFSV